MKSIFKKIAFVLALAMVVTAFPAKTAAAASEPTLKAKRTLYIGGDATEQYADSAWASVKKGDYTVAFASKDEEIVTVNAKNGRLHAVSVGETVVTATFSKDGAKDIVKECAVKVKQNAGAVELDEKSAEMYVGDKITVKATAENENTTDKLHFAPKADADKEIIDVDYDNGEITAKAEGTATVLVYATQWEYNKDTKKWAKKVTTDKVEFTVTVKASGLASAKQISAKQISVECTNETLAKEIVEKSDNLKVVYLNAGNEKKDFVKSVTADKEDAKKIIVELYNNIAKDVTYKISFGDGEAVSIVGADLNAVDSIKIVTTKGYKDQYTEIKVEYYDVNGIKINPTTQDVKFTAPESVDYVISGNKIFFFAVGKTATVTATYNMGYDKDANKIPDKTDTVVITSYDTAATANDVVGWAVDANSAKTAKDLTYSKDVIKVAVDETRQLFLKYTETNYLGNSTVDKFTAGTGKDAWGYIYDSGNDSVVMVDNNGVIYPVAAGSTEIIVKRNIAYNNQPVIAVVPVTVYATRNLASFTVSQNKSTLAIDTGDMIKVTAPVKDQLGSDYQPLFSAKLLSDVSGVTVTMGGTVLTTKELPIAVDAYAWPNDAVFHVTATGSAPQAKTVQIQITAKDKLTYAPMVKAVILTVKDGAAAASYSLDLSNKTIDLNFAGMASYEGISKFQSKLTLNSYDNNGYFAGEKALTTKDKATKEGDFYYTVTKNTDNDTKLGTVDGKVDGKPVFIAVTENNGHYTPVKDVKGTYILRVFKKNANSDQLVATNSISVVDSSAAVTVNQEGFDLADIAADVNGKVQDAGVMAAIQEKLTFYRAGARIWNAPKIISVDCTQSAGKLYVTSIEVTDKAANGKTYNYKVNVGKNFNIVNTVNAYPVTGNTVTVSTGNTATFTRTAKALTIATAGAVSLEYFVVGEGLASTWQPVVATSAAVSYSALAKDKEYTVLVRANAGSGVAEIKIAPDKAVVSAEPAKGASVTVQAKNGTVDITNATVIFTRNSTTASAISITTGTAITAGNTEFMYRVKGQTEWIDVEAGTEQYPVGFNNDGDMTLEVYIKAKADEYVASAVKEIVIEKYTE